MNQKRETIILALACLLLVLVVGTAVLAQTSSSFNLEWHVMGSGGSESSSASYKVQGTVGQNLASPRISDSTSFSAASGYWVMGAGSTIYLPVMLDN